MSRTAAANGFDSLTPLMRACGLRRGLGGHAALATQASAIPLLSRLLALDETTVASLSYAMANGVIRLLGHSVHPDFVSVQRRKFCPRCLEESGHHRAVWDMVLMTVCPAHSLYLNWRCPACSNPLSWAVPSPRVCRCGHDLRRDTGTPVPRHQLGGVSAVQHLMLTPPGDLDGMPAEVGVGGALQMVYMFGVSDSDMSYPAKPAKFVEGHRTTVHLLLDTGWRTCADWPKSFHALLDRLAERSASRPTWRGAMTKRYGILPEWLSRVAHEPYGRVALGAYAEHISLRPYPAARWWNTRGRRPDAAPPEARVTLAEAARVLQYAPIPFRDLADRHGLTIVGTGSNGQPVLMQVETVDRLWDDLRGLVGEDGAKRLLGIDTPLFVELRGSDLLPPLASGVAAELFGRPAWRATDLEAFVARFQAAAGQECGIKGLVGVKTAVGAIDGMALDIGTVLRSVLEGRLRVSALCGTQPGLTRLRFRKTDVAALRRAQGEPVRHLPIVRAAKMLGVGPKSVRYWVRCGWLATVGGSGPLKRSARVTEETLTAFLRDYVTASELRRTHGAYAAKRVIAQLVGTGAKPVSGPSVDGGPQFLFRRIDIKSLTGPGTDGSVAN